MVCTPKPANIPAKVRFANADSNVNADSKPDVRALSFAVEPQAGSARTSPPTIGRPSPSTTRTRSRRRSRSSRRRRWRQGRVGAAVQGQAVVRANGRPRTARRSTSHCCPTRSRRYWSTVPFRHGPTEVIKYSLTPCAGNPAGDLESHRSRHAAGRAGASPRGRQPDELFRLRAAVARHQAMTYWGQAEGRELLDRECQRRVEGIAVAFSQRSRA